MEFSCMQDTVRDVLNMVEFFENCEFIQVIHQSWKILEYLGKSWKISEYGFV